MLKIMLIDDEQDARQLLSVFLSCEQDCQIIAEASSVAEGILQLGNVQPDLIFLDIELKDGTGFDLLKAFPNPDFHIVFATAFDEFALQAFQFNAIDYLLKPLTPEDVHRVLGKIRNYALPKSTFHQQISSLIQHVQKQKPEKVILSTAEGMYFIPLEEVIYLQGEGNYTTVFTQKQERILVSQNIGSFDYLEHDERFFRIHQSYMINLNAVRQFLRNNDGDFAVLENNAHVPVSRRKKEAFLEKMKNL